MPTGGLCPAVASVLVPVAPGRRPGVARRRVARESALGRRRCVGACRGRRRGGASVSYWCRPASVGVARGARSPVLVRAVVAGCRRRCCGGVRARRRVGRRRRRRVGRGWAGAWVGPGAGRVAARRRVRGERPGLDGCRLAGVGVGRGPGGCRLLRVRGARARRCVPGRRRVRGRPGAGGGLRGRPGGRRGCCRPGGCGPTAGAGAAGWAGAGGGGCRLDGVRVSTAGGVLLARRRVRGRAGRGRRRVRRLAGAGRPVPRRRWCGVGGGAAPAVVRGRPGGDGGCCRLGRVGSAGGSRVLGPAGGRPGVPRVRWSAGSGRAGAGSAGGATGVGRSTAGALGRPGARRVPGRRRRGRPVATAGCCRLDGGAGRPGARGAGRRRCGGRPVGRRRVRPAGVATAGCGPGRPGWVGRMRGGCGWAAGAGSAGAGVPGRRRVRVAAGWRRVRGRLGGRRRVAGSAGGRRRVAGRPGGRRRVRGRSAGVRRVGVGRGMRRRVLPARRGCGVGLGGRRRGRSAGGSAQPGCSTGGRLRWCRIAGGGGLAALLLSDCAAASAAYSGRLPRRRRVGPSMAAAPVGRPGQRVDWSDVLPTLSGAVLPLSAAVPSLTGSGS